MSALNLPKPVNTYAGEDELRNPNGVAGVANGQAVQENEDAAKGIVKPQEEKKMEKKDEGPKATEPKPWEFKVDLPGVTAMDLCVYFMFYAMIGRS